ncbi:hypothetical protein Poli38472_005878 [Pythium oligandrum]|uniref:MOSC domain-containing protein n=1 Tax=Pythium oligandrum TaxID=41045 RepID=A0A8K1CRW6_PYTOL|nr:hypothetical protein Poli38472_005878 [Pythium oligandrum]|eukprot:TMW68410.1 hypothetical protein Poli38472_005878 [Pythium oligandrum]
MYLRADHAEKSIPALRAFIKANPLGILITALDSDLHPFLQCSHIPWVLDIADETSDTELGRLRGHMARANPQAKALAEYAKAKAAAESTPTGLPVTLEKEVLVLFNSPVNHYVSATFHVETKAVTGKVVPTWNYAAVQAYGKMTVYYDMKSESSCEYLAQQIRDLTHVGETEIMGFDNPWKVDDAPAKYIEMITKAIIGVEIEITNLGGKWKMSQEATPGDRAGILEGFTNMGTERAEWMAKTIEERCAISDAKMADKTEKQGELSSMKTQQVALCGVTLALAVALHAVVRRSRLTRAISTTKTTKSDVKSVLQRDVEEEAAAEASAQLFAVGSEVNTVSMGPGKILKYDLDSKTLSVEVTDGGRTSVLKLKADAIKQMKIRDIYIYPIKSCRGIRVKHAHATAKGFRNDRTWMFCDTKGKFISMRRYPKMALIAPVLDDHENPTVITLTAKGMPDLRVPILHEGKGPEKTVTVWKSDLIAIDQGDAAANWINKFLDDVRGDQEFRFVRVKESFRRPTNPKYAPDHETAFADAYPYLLVVHASVDSVNEHLKDKIEIERFRANLVVTGAPPFADEAWNCLTIGGLRFRNVKPCDRCAVPCVDPHTGQTSSEPRKSMVSYRNGETLGFRDGTRQTYYFGSNLVAEELGQVSVGAPVRVLTMKKAVYA